MKRGALDITPGGSEPLLRSQSVVGKKVEGSPGAAQALCGLPCSYDSGIRNFKLIPITC